MTAEQRAGLSDAALAMTQPCIDELIKDISRRVQKAGAITDTAEYQLYRAQALGESKKAIEQAVSKQIGISEEVIASLFEYVADKSLSLDENGSLKRMTEAYTRMTQSKTRELLRDLWADTPEGKVQPLQTAYARAMDFAFRQVATGTLDLNTAIRRAVTPLAKRGLRTIEQKSGRSVGIEYACRRYIMDQLGQLDDEIQHADHDALGCDGWEISAHAACAPDHEPIQGRQYGDAEFEKLNNCMGTFYLDDWSNEDDTLADFTAIDTIGLLDGSPFDGGVYDTHVASLAAEILSGYPYTLDSVLGEERIQGYIPAGTRREALQQLAFAIGAVVDCSRGEIIRIVPAPQRASGLIGTDRRLQDGSKVTLLALVTAVSVTAHRYIPGEASEELYKDTLEPGTYRVTFDAPAVADSLAVRGAELSERGVNHCTLTVSKAAEVCVTGRKYSDSATVLRREASNLPSNAQGNEVSVPDATLVSPDRAAAVAARVLDYYAQRYEQTFRMVAGDEKLADRLIVESFGGEMVRGVVTKLEFDLTGGFLADAKIVGRKLSNNAAAYAGEEIHAGERSFI